MRKHWRKLLRRIEKAWEVFLLASIVVFFSLAGGRFWLPSEVEGEPGVTGLQDRWFLHRSRVRVLLASNFRELSVRDASLGNPLVVRFTGTSIELAAPDGTSPGSPQSGFRIDAVAAGFVRFREVRYRGSFEAFVNPLGVPVLVNELPVEEYLKGVVPGELNPGQFPQMEALKAQSVAARTFALSEIGSRGRHGYDLFPDVRSQVYGGVDAEKDLSNRAVDQTRGLFAAFEGRPIVAFFSSTCGGVTANYGEAFQRPEIPYLKGGVPCPDGNSRYARWNVEIEPSAIQGSLDKYAGVGRLRALEIRRRDGTGRVVEMRFEGDKDERILKGLSLRYALGLRSHFITSLKVHRDSAGYIRKIDVRGKGFGHGVGMCQIGAVELSRKGFHFGQILRRYYSGIRIRSLEAAENIPGT